jgi:NAD+ diphosphatase
VLAAILARSDDEPFAAPSGWASLRTIGGDLSAADAGTFIQALSLGRWLLDAPFCPACGGRTELRAAGWSRHCPDCGREHFPRTDPAVIVAVESADGERLLLGANANWGGRMYSCFAGFTEAGESLESTVHRELEEESGVRLASLRYVSSQPWPFPRSLMLGFRAVVLDENDVRPDGEEIIDARWFTRDEIGTALAGEGPVGLPGPSSIARALIVSWFEERA